jgi:hypothetical protein
LADIYKRMREAHPAYMQTRFKMSTYGMQEGTETYKKAFPKSFQFYFFRWIKAISSKTGKLDIHTEEGMVKARRKFKHLPQAFIISAGKSKCTMHEHGCPTPNCPYLSVNKKVVMFKGKKTKNIVKPPVLRQRVFYREDFKAKLRDIFMTREEQLNCTFEPKVAALNNYDDRDTVCRDKVIQPVDHNSYA